MLKLQAPDNQRKSRRKRVW